MPGCSYAAVHIGDLRSHVKRCKKAPGWTAKRQAVRGVDGRPVALRPAAEMPQPDSLTQLLGLIDLLPLPTQGPDLAPALPVPAEAQDPSVVWPLAQVPAQVPIAQMLPQQAMPQPAQPAMPAAQAVPVPAPEAAPHAPGVVMLAPPPASMPPALLLAPATFPGAAAFAVKAESESEIL